MLPPFIIEQIRRREEEERCRSERKQPRLELPVAERRPVPPRQEKEDVGERGVVIVDLGFEA